MARVQIRIYDEDTGEDLVQEDTELFDDEEEIASQAFRVQKHYYNRLDQEVGDWTDF